VTVTANFNSRQRHQATKDAGEIAECGTCSGVNEQTAAALAYGQHQLPSVLVGSTLRRKVENLRGRGRKRDCYEVLYSTGDNHLGGDDFNHRIVQWIVREFGARDGARHQARRAARACPRVGGGGQERPQCRAGKREGGSTTC